jgi:hypothetical protein
MTKIQTLKAKEIGIAEEKELLIASEKAAKAFNKIRQIIKDANIDAKKEFDPNRPYK